MKLKLLALLLISSQINAAPAPEVHCLATNIYNEARGEGYLGMLAVAQVTINRTKDPRFHEQLCDVVYAKNQFSWTRNTTFLLPDRKAIMIAALALRGRHELSKFKALYFHSTKINPGWKYKRLTRIGNHIFYV